MAPRLKVFTWSNGFHAFTVATSSRAKALAAWGIEQDIFADGLARQIDEGPDHDEALARPGEVIQRGEAVDPGVVGKAARRAPPKPSARRKAVEALEARLAALDIEQAAERAGFDEKLAALQAERDAAVARQDDDRERLKAKLRKAREAD